MSYINKIISLLLILECFAFPSVSRPAAATSRFPVLLSRLGCRFTLIPEPQNGTVRILPLGPQLPEFTGLRVQIHAPGRDIVFPDPAGFLPDRLQWNSDLSAVTYHFPVPGGEFSYQIRSPFTPGNVKWRDAPVMFIRLRFENTGGNPVNYTVDFTPGFAKERRTVRKKTVTGIRLFHPFRLDQSRLNITELTPNISPHLQTRSHAGSDAAQFIVSGTVELTVIGAISDGWTVENQTLHARFTVPAAGIREKWLAVSVYTRTPVLKVDGQAFPFHYTDSFVGSVALAKSALENKAGLLAEDAAYRSCFLFTDDPQPEKRLAALCLQSFLANTWLMQQPGGGWRYSEWEGFPLFHSTMDVVFNTSLFHIMFTPEFLGDMLRHWPQYGEDGHLPHDMGRGLILDRNQYPIPMTVEEDTNFILLHYLYGNFSGDWSIARTQGLFLNRLVDKILATDVDGNGLPDIGVINTFDDAPPAINSAQNQLYLGIKVAAALEAYLEFNRYPMSRVQYDAVAEMIKRIRNTLRSCRLPDHYPIYIPGRQPVSAGILYPHSSGDQHDPHHDTGSNNGYSNYLFHGAVPLYICGKPFLNDFSESFRRHIISAHEKTNTRFGDAHRDGVSNVWISQNMWRDLAASYLDAPLDFSRLHRQYRDMETHCFSKKNATQWQGFCDSPFNSFLTFYSRGVPFLFFHWAQAHFSFSRKNSALTIQAPAKPGQIPLPFFSRGKPHEIPVLIWNETTRQPTRIQHSEVLDGMKLNFMPYGE